MRENAHFDLESQAEPRGKLKRWYEHTLARVFVSPILIIGPLLTDPTWKTAVHHAGMQFTMLTLGTYLMQQHFYGEKMRMGNQSELDSYLEGLANMSIGMGVSMYAYESSVSLFSALLARCKHKKNAEERIPLVNGSF